MVEQTGTAVGHVIALLFAASREAVDVSLRNVIPFMAFVSLLIALVQETALGSLIAHALTPLANSLWGLVLLSLIRGIPFLSPVLGPGAAISQVIGVMIGTQIGAGAISPAFALPALFTPLNDTMMILVGAMCLGFVQIITGMAISFVKKLKHGQIMDAVWEEVTWWVVFAGLALAILKVTNLVIILGGVMVPDRC